MTREEIKQLAGSGLERQKESLTLLSEQLGEDFIDAVELVVRSNKVVTTGLGKSGFVAKKMSATLTSVHVQSMYLHPVDALHGDLGVMASGDVLVAFSKSGETPEVVALVALAQEMRVNVISITNRFGTTLATRSDIALTAPITSELDQHDLLPTASTTQSMILADLICVCVAQMQGGMVEKLRLTHPRGSIGAALLRSIDEIMHSGNSIPRLGGQATVSDAIRVLNTTALGIICVMGPDNRLNGVITDGDVRRFAGSGLDAHVVLVADVMTRKPITVLPSQSLHSALQIMENRERQIAVVPVVDEIGKCVGVVRVHDIVRAQL